MKSDLTVPYFTITNIILGIIGAVFGTFPYVYARTLGRLSLLRKAEQIFHLKLLKQEELTDLPSIHEFLKSIGIKEHQGVVKLHAQTGVMFNKNNTLTEWIMAYDAEGKIIGNLDTKEASELFRTNSDRSRNRVAFGFIALGYSFQILGLALGVT